MSELLTAENLVVVFAALWGVSEALASIPRFKSNSIFQLVSAILKKLAGK